MNCLNGQGGKMAQPEHIKHIIARYMKKLLEQKKKAEEKGAR